jgi:hypothetical protein
VSVLTRKPDVTEVAGVRGQATRAARQVGPLAGKAVPIAQQAAQQAVPLAKNAGTSMRQGSGYVIAWATPLVDAARSWAAPQIEQSARAVSETIAPMVSSALISAAQKIDAPSRKPRRRRTGLVVGSMLLLVASVAALLALRQRQNSAAYTSAAPSPGSEPRDGEGSGTGNDVNAAEPDADMNGHQRIV